MYVHLQPDVLFTEAELVEDLGVLLGGEDPRRRIGRRIVGEDVHERRSAGDLRAHRVRRMIGVGRDLDRELASDR